MKRTLNWGILGTSFVSGVMADAIRAERSSALYAVAGRTPKNVRAFAAKYEVEKVSDDYDDLISDPGVDVVYIALPNHIHHRYVVKAAEAGKAILCEKSFSIDMAKAHEALDAVARNKVFLAEGLMYLNHPLANKIVELVRDDRVGELRAIQGRYCAAISDLVNRDSRGVLYNLGCYPASLAHLVLQQACGDRVFADSAISSTARHGEDGNICEAAASIRLANGVVCQLHTAEDYGLHADFTVLGDKGSLQLRSNPWLPDTENVLVLTEYETRPQIIDLRAEGDGFFYQVRRVREALEQGRLELSRPAARPGDSLEIMALLTRWESACEVHLLGAGSLPT